MTNRSVAQFAVRAIGRISRIKPIKYQNITVRLKYLKITGDSGHANWGSEYVELCERWQAEIKKIFDELREVSRKNIFLKSQLRLSNEKLLMLQESFDARGVLKFFEDRKLIFFSYEPNNRKANYSTYFAKDVDFQKAVSEEFGDSITGDKVGSIAENLFDTASKEVLTYPVGGNITVRKCSFSDDELKLLKVICKMVCLKVDVVES